MRHFFILGFELILGVIIVIAALGIILGGLAIMGGNTDALTPFLGPVAQELIGPAGPVIGADGQPIADAGGSPVVQGAIVMLIGLIGLIFYGGLMFLGLGIYHNTRRTAVAMERMLIR